VRRALPTFAVALLALAALPAMATAAAAPAIEYSTPSLIRNKEATLRFSIDPEGLETSYEVMYGTEAGNYHPSHEPIDGVLPEGNEPVALAKVIPVFFEGGLKPGTEYHWRVVAKNAEGETVGTDQVFTRRSSPVAWQEDAIPAATQTALLPDQPAHVQDGYIRVAPAAPATPGTDGGGA